MKTFSREELKKWERRFPILKDMVELKETVWINPDKQPFSDAIKTASLGIDDIQDASDRLDRFAAYFIKAFPETVKTEGLLESEIRCIDRMKSHLQTAEHCQIEGKLLLKLDSNLPVSGSIKARGGIYEVLKFAEDIAKEHGYLHPGESYEVFDSEPFKKLFSAYSITVGSTGNLGLSIGIISAKLGFHVTAHMSADARTWKKELLKSKGVTVIEYPTDYSVAVQKGRAEAQNNPMCHFVDDENSTTLFLGYAVAALRLKKQFDAAGYIVDRTHPLFVYLPCGVGGGPGGVAFGLKLIFGDAAHCFFAEPTHSPCMMLGMATKQNNAVCVQDFGIDNQTDADGLAVGRASGFVGKFMRPFISGCYTLNDERMYRMLAMLSDSENIFLEPSALAGMFGPVLLAKDEKMQVYIKSENIADYLKNSIQLVWATGGSMVPAEDIKEYYERGMQLNIGQRFF